MKHKSLFFRLDKLTEEQLFAEIDEYYHALSRTLINFTVDDFIAATKVFFAPVIRKALARTNVEDATIGEGNKRARRKASAKYEEIRKFARQVIAANPKLQGATPNRLAKKIHKMKSNWSVRTIRRALAPSK
jgi:hypothetical protein